ncbi:21081_t:CDS:2, partial [Racocetra persica]
SSFEIEKDCTNKKSSSLDNSEASVSDNAIEKDRGNDIQDLDSVAQPLNYEESDNDQGNETQDLNSSIQVKLHVEKLLIITYNIKINEKYSGDKYKFQINNQFKALKNKIEKNNSKIEKVDKANNEPVNNFIKRVPSNLTEEDSLPSINEILKPSVTQSSHPSKETNLSHPKIVNTKTSVEGSNRNI